MTYKRSMIAIAMTLASTGCLAAYGDPAFVASAASTDNMSTGSGGYGRDVSWTVAPRTGSDTETFAGGLIDTTSESLINAKPVAVHSSNPTDSEGLPEPDTYALMLAGLGAVGFIVLRRRAD